MMAILAETVSQIPFPCKSVSINSMIKRLFYILIDHRNIKCEYEFDSASQIQNDGYNKLSHRWENMVTNGFNSVFDSISNCVVNDNDDDDTYEENDYGINDSDAIENNGDHDIEENIPHESEAIEDRSLLPTIKFKSFVPNINTQEDIEDELVLPFSYQYMFDKRTSPWEMKDWDQEELNDFVIKPEKIDRLYHMVADDEDQNFRSWEICCRMDYKREKYFVEMYANCDYTGFDCQGGGHVSITKLPNFFLENMVTMDQNPNQIYKSLRKDGYNVQEPDLLHKMHPKFWNNAPMLKYLCHNAIYKHRDVLPHFKEHLPKILADSVDDFIKVKDWDNE